MCLCQMSNIIIVGVTIGVIIGIVHQFDDDAS
jgi:hypothetical protein